MGRTHPNTFTYVQYSTVSLNHGRRYIRSLRVTWIGFPLTPTPEPATAAPTDELSGEPVDGCVVLKVLLSMLCASILLLDTRFGGDGDSGSSAASAARGGVDDEGPSIR